MFGDLGHGSLLFIFALYIFSLKKNVSKPQPLDGLIKQRYLLLFMGVCAMFCGLMYNDFMSMAVNFFGSCYDEDNIKIPKCTYPVGMDPVWNASNNKLQIYNSLKMKLSIIFGVS